MPDKGDEGEGGWTKGSRVSSPVSVVEAMAMLTTIATATATQEEKKKGVVSWNFDVRRIHYLAS